MKFLKTIRNFLRKIDIFGSNQFLRYRDEPRFGTMTGGIMTIVIITIFIILFWGETLNTLNKVNINYSDSQYKIDNPPLITFNGENNKFIFAIGLVGAKLNDTKRYFDITLSTPKYQSSVWKSEQIHPLKPCEYEQWASVNEIGANSYKSVGLMNYLCPPKDLLLQLQGKYTSQLFQFLKITVSKCKSSTDPTRPCATDAQIAEKGNFYTINFYFMNAVINSGDKVPLDYYFEDRNYIPFDLSHTIVSNLYMGEHKIITDNSLYPTEDISQEWAITVNQLADIKTSPLSNTDYVKICLRKSPDYTVSTRSFTKIDGFFSYIGGLFGFAMSALIIISFYSQVTYELEMGGKMFYYQDKQPLYQNIFNIFIFLVYVPYELLRKIGIKVPWGLMDRYYVCRQEIQKQLDVSLLMNKITYLEKCMNIVFEDHQFRSIYLQHRPTVKEAQELRLNHGLNKIIHKNYQQINQEIQDLSKKSGIHPNGFGITEGNRYITPNQALNQNQNFMTVNFLSVKNDPKKHKHREGDDPVLMRRVDSVDLQKDSDKQLRSECVRCEYGKPEGEMLESLEVQKQKSNKSGKQKQDKPLDLKQILEELLLNANKKTSERSEKGNKQEKVQDIAHKQQDQMIDKNLKFISAAANDLKQIEEESRRGNRWSQKIYDRLNTQITKEQLNVLNQILKITEHDVQMMRQSTANLSNSKCKNINNSGANTKSSQQKKQFEKQRKKKQADQKQRDADTSRPFGLQIILESKQRLPVLKDTL